jgi:glutathione S-transferase
MQGERMKLYGDSQSGNCYKIQLVCAMLNIPHQWIAVDILAGETRSAAFLRKNPNGKIPTLELDDGRTLSESNAIINYLAADSDLLPKDTFTLAKMQQWQCFEQYSHEPYIAVARFIAKYQGMPASRQAEYKAKQSGGYLALGVMEQQLAATPYLCGDQLTNADISLYAYTHVAHEGGFELERYPAIQAWLDRIEATPGFIAMA